MWDTSLTLKFQFTKSYFGRARGLREISHLFKPSSVWYYPQYMLIENYCLNIEGSNEFQICLTFLAIHVPKFSYQEKLVPGTLTFRMLFDHPKIKT